MEKNPWVINGEKNIYSNPWISVTEYDVTNPGGGNGIYGKVHFKNIAVGVIVLDESLNTYLDIVGKLPKAGVRRGQILLKVQKENYWKKRD
jgi:hypothetical protein